MKPGVHFKKRYSSTLTPRFQGLTNKMRVEGGRAAVCHRRNALS